MILHVFTFHFWKVSSAFQGPQSVESSYLALADGNCIPRRWHLEGRWGIPIEKIAQGKHQAGRTQVRSWGCWDELGDVGNLWESMEFAKKIGLDFKHVE